LWPTSVEVVDGTGETGWGGAHPLLHQLQEKMREQRIGYVLVSAVTQFGRAADALPAIITAAQAGGTWLVVGTRSLLAAIRRQHAPRVRGAWGATESQKVLITERMRLGRSDAESRCWKA
jgi:hypothetical protein